jgi:hypothetical protein
VDYPVMSGLKRFEDDECMTSWRMAPAPRAERGLATVYPDLTIWGLGRGFLGSSLEARRSTGASSDSLANRGVR